MPLNPAVKRLMQEDLEFKVSLGYTLSPCLKINKQKIERMREREREREIILDYFCPLNFIICYSSCFTDMCNMFFINRIWYIFITTNRERHYCASQWKLNEK
jgi:hypothetical protein